MKDRDSSDEEVVWLTPKKMEIEYDFPRSTQAKYRMKEAKNRIPHSKIGKFVFYKKSIIDQWIDDHRIV